MVPLAALAALATDVVVSAAFAAEPADFQGRFVASDDAVQAAVKQAVDKGAMQFSALIRPIARRRLATTIQGSTWVAFAGTAKALTITSSQRPGGVTTGLDREPVEIVADGKAATVRRWMEGGVLHSEACNGEGGCLVSTFALTGDALTVTQETRAPQLSEPIVLTVHYTGAVGRQ